MNRILSAILVLLIFTTGSVFGQSDATDFTAVDCNGNTHKLFEELDKGKVVVLVWVMPCSSCINDSRGAYEAVQSFSSSNPGQVLYYMIDDFGNTGCSSLLNWANANSIKNNVIIFKNSGVVIDENDYGGTGMPHVVVVGPDRKIYLNKINGKNNQAAIQTAISTALTKVSVEEFEIENIDLKLYPNPASETLTVSYRLNNYSTVNFSVVNILGETVLKASAREAAGNYNFNLDINTLPNGLYFLEMNNGQTSGVKRFVISR